MRKLTAFIMVLLVATSLFAVSHLQFGPSATANYELSGDDDLQEVLGDTDSYTYGGDARLTIGKYQLSGLAQMKVADDTTYLNTNISLNYVFFHGNMLNVTLGLGPRCVFATDNWKDWEMSNGGGSKYDNFFDVIKESNITYRIGANFSLLGLGVAVAYYLPADASISDPAQSWLPDFDEGSVSFSLLFGII